MSETNTPIPTISSSVEKSHDNAAFDKSSDDQNSESSFEAPVQSDIISENSKSSSTPPSYDLTAETIKLKNRNFHGQGAENDNEKSMTCSSCSSSLSNQSISTADNKINEKSNESKKARDVTFNLPESPKKEKEIIKKEPVKTVESQTKKPGKDVQKKSYLHRLLEKFSINKKYRTLSFYRNNTAYFVTILIWILLQVFFVLLQLLVLHPKINIWLIFSRLTGILLNFNCCLIYLLVLRRLSTYLRNSVIGRRFLVLDESLAFHKFLGFWIAFLAFIHTLFHCINLYYMSDDHYSRIFGPKHVNSDLISRFISIFRTSDTNSSVVEFSYDLTQENLKNTTFDLGNQWPGRGSYGELLFWTASGFGWVGKSAVPTGWLLVIVLTIMVTFALPIIRRKGLFQLFYWTHWLHIAFYILLILHAEQFWKWFIGPAVIILIERLYTLFRIRSSKFGETYIKDVNLLSSNVTNLVITRPPNFKFKCGDYIFINIPKIAKYEWHPFTISSAPEVKDEINLHIRSLGNWTNKLHEYFLNISNYNKMFEGRNISVRARPDDKRGSKPAESEFKFEAKRKMSTMVVLTDFKRSSDETHLNIPSIHEEDEDEETQERKLKQRNSNQIEVNLNIANKLENIWINIRVDGPYGTASRGIFYSDHAVLIAGGIGVTPFASILQSLWFKYSNAMKTCPSCNHQWYDKFHQKTLKKVDFIWVNRDYQAFEWFIELLGELELQQLTLEREFRNPNERFLNIHLYMTSAKVEREIMLDASQIADFRMNKYKDTPDTNVKGFSMKLKPGRPNLEKIFTDIEQEQKGKVDVFFCGNAEFGNIVNRNCLAKKFKFSKEIF